MNKINIIISTLIISTIFASAILFVSCNKNEIPREIIDEFAEIDKFSAEVGDFHTFALKKYLEEVYSEDDVLNEEMFEEITNFIKREILSYNFKHIKIDKNNAAFSNIFDYATMTKILSIGRGHSDLSVFTRTNSNGKSSEDAVLPDDLNIVLIEQKTKVIDDSLAVLVERSNTFDEFKVNFLNFSIKELANIQTEQTLNEYMYLRYFADTYLSSIEVWGEFFTDLDDITDDWYDPARRGWGSFWNAVKPHVLTDAKGAAVGALMCAAGGPKAALAGAMLSGCGASILSILDTFF